MSVERTFSIIKPDATARKRRGAVNAMIEKAGSAHRGAKAHVHDYQRSRDVLCRASRATVLSRTLVDFMTSGPVVVQVLEGENAVAVYRDLMGATDPAKAAAGTIRKAHAQSIGENSVHGSDAAETAAEGNRPVFLR